ncbi:MAG: hypothetical protein ACREMD_03590 [Gemmatimonadota bacterium]
MVVVLFPFMWCIIVTCAQDSTVDREPASIDEDLAEDVNTLNDVVTWIGSLTLEENQDVINVSPKVSLNSVAHPRYLIADSKEAQIRLYSKAGHLVDYFGGPGGGPGEFERPVRAIRTSSALIVIDMNGRLSKFTTGGQVVWTKQLPLAPVYDAELFNDSLLVVAGHGRSTPPAPLLHVIDFVRGTIVRSFFTSPYYGTDLWNASISSGIMSVALSDQNVVGLFALIDTLYYYDISGTLISKLHIPFKHYRRLQESFPAQSSPEQYQKWLESYSVASHLFWVDDGFWIIQYRDWRDNHPVWSMTIFRQEGQPVVELRDTPKLLAVSSDESVLVFQDPGYLTPNHWKLGKLNIQRSSH